MFEVTSQVTDAGGNVDVGPASLAGTGLSPAALALHLLLFALFPVFWPTVAMGYQWRECETHFWEDLIL